MSTRDPLFPHLLPAARELLQNDNPQRIQALRADRWIDYPCAIEALSRLQELLETPRRERMPCMLLAWTLQHRQDPNHREVHAREPAELRQVQGCGDKASRQHADATSTGPEALL